MALQVTELTASHIREARTHLRQVEDEVITRACAWLSERDRPDGYLVETIDAAINFGDPGLLADLLSTVLYVKVEAGPGTWVLTRKDDPEGLEENDRYRYEWISAERQRGQDVPEGQLGGGR